MNKFKELFINMKTHNKNESKRRKRRARKNNDETKEKDATKR